MIPDFSKTLDDIAHVDITTINSNSHSDMYSSLRPMTSGEVAYMQDAVEKIYGRFTSLVSEGRSLDKEYVDSIAQGRVWSGDDAVRLKLADRKGTVLDAVKYAAMTSEQSQYAPDLSEWDIVEYPKPLTTMEMLLKGLGSSASVSVFGGTPLGNVEEAFKGWNATQGGKVYARLPYELVIRP